MPECVSCNYRLLNRDGVLMAYTGPPERQSQVSSAVASSIWDVYDKGGKAVLAGEHLDFLLIDCEVKTNACVCVCMCVCVCVFVCVLLSHLLWVCMCTVVGLISARPKPASCTER